MQIKKGVILDGLHVSMRIVLVVVEDVYREHGREPVITSALDSTYFSDASIKHSLGSYHDYGMALDFRTRFFENKAECLQVANKIRKKLGHKYTVIFEKNHIHIQYNWGKF